MQYLYELSILTIMKVKYNAIIKTNKKYKYLY